jgi:glycerophosphoryl diester phosphodiesterase
MEFSLAEVKRLRVHERSNKRGSGAAFTGRFPYESSLFEVPTLEEILQLVNGLKKSHGRIMGLYIEIKGAEIHRQYNLDPTAELLAILDRYDYLEASDPIWVQSFDAEVLKTMRHKHKTRLKLVQLIGENRWRVSATDFDYLKTKTGLKEVAGYADGIGPWINHVVTGKNLAGDLKLTGIVSMAHQLNLKVHPYTMRADQLPDYVETFEDLLHIFFNVVQVDGIFTDFPDQAVKYLGKTSLN